MTSPTGRPDHRAIELLPGTVPSIAAVEEQPVQPAQRVQAGQVVIRPDAQPLAPDPSCPACPRTALVFCMLALGLIAAGGYYAARTIQLTHEIGAPADGGPIMDPRNATLAEFATLAKAIGPVGVFLMFCACMCAGFCRKVPAPI